MSHSKVDQFNNKYVNFIKSFQPLIKKSIKYFKIHSNRKQR
jgi:hypothetical protein